MIDRYDWAGGREAMLRFGPETAAPVLVVAMPLLEEWNRTRAFTVALLRALAARGIASVLPDLPGHGESLTPVGTLVLGRFAEAVQAVTHAVQAGERATLGLGIRSGALLDYRAPHSARWHFAPTTGVDMVGELHRTWLAGEGNRRERTVSAMTEGTGATVIAGTTLPAAFLASLADAVPCDQPDRRVVRLATDRRPADRHVEGPPLWRRAEPGNDPALVKTLADDIAAWIPTCVP